ncbi:unnamed protein product [Haemonchus placei]|uniref:Phage_integrase domain-containing protein n=1 Tax=Haemonchus placei TaxID=6290 RepID=A0A0N4X3V8_HAEPC|nr:unnamed protein product [Haemonchus placei]
MEKFREWRNGPDMHNDPTPQARNLYLGKCSAEARYKSMPTVIAAPSCFCGPLQGVNREIQDSLLKAVKRSPPPPQHRTKIRPEQLGMIIKVGSTDSDPEVIQAAALALIQFKALLRISEAQALRVPDVKSTHNDVWHVSIPKSKTDQHAKGTVVAIRFNAQERALLNKYLSTLGNATFLFQSGSTGLPLALSTLRDGLRHISSKANLQWFNITSHSFRGGAATQALSMIAHQMDVMQAGRWKTLGGFQNRVYISRPSF